MNLLVLEVDKTKKKTIVTEKKPLFLDRPTRILAAVAIFLFYEIIKRLWIIKWKEQNDNNETMWRKMKKDAKKEDGRRGATYGRLHRNKLSVPFVQS